MSPLLFALVPIAYYYVHARELYMYMYIALASWRPMEPRLEVQYISRSRTSHWMDGELPVPGVVRPHIPLTFPQHMPDSALLDFWH